MTQQMHLVNGEAQLGTIPTIMCTVVKAEIERLAAWSLVWQSARKDSNGTGSWTKSSGSGE
jgi:hypothetical protein